MLGDAKLTWWLAVDPPESATGAPRPLVVLLAWIAASQPAIAKLCHFLNALGCDVVVVQPHPASLWVPALAAGNAQAVLQQLESQLQRSGPRPLLFAVFSGAAKAIYYKVLPLLGPVLQLSDAAALASQHLSAIQQMQVGAGDALVGEFTAVQSQLSRGMYSSCPSPPSKPLPPSDHHAALHTSAAAAAPGPPCLSQSQPAPLVHLQPAEPAQIPSTPGSTLPHLAAVSPAADMVRVMQAMQVAVPAPWDHASTYSSPMHRHRISSMHLHAIQSAHAAIMGKGTEEVKHTVRSSSWVSRATAAWRLLKPCGERLPGAMGKGTLPAGEVNQVIGIEAGVGPSAIILPASATTSSQKAGEGWGGLHTSTSIPQPPGQPWPANARAGKPKPALASQSSEVAPLTPSLPLPQPWHVPSSQATGNAASRVGLDNSSNPRRTLPPRYPLCAACFCGQWFDSSPVDFTSQAGASMVLALAQPRSQHLWKHPAHIGDGGSCGAANNQAELEQAAHAKHQRQERAQQPQQEQQELSQQQQLGPSASTSSIATALLQAGVRLAAGAADFLGLEVWEQQRREMWAVLAGSWLACQGPSLFTYSWDDSVADPFRIQRLAQALRVRGASVLEQAWPTSSHCAHLRLHPAQCRELVVAWLQEAKAAYLMRRAHSQHADALQAALPGSNAKPATASLMSKL